MHSQVDLRTAIGRVFVLCPTSLSFRIRRQPGEKSKHSISRLAHFKRPDPCSKGVALPPRIAKLFTSPPWFIAGCTRDDSISRCIRDAPEVRHAMGWYSLQNLTACRGFRLLSAFRRKTSTIDPIFEASTTNKHYGIPGISLRPLLKGGFGTLIPGSEADIPWYRGCNPR